MLDASNQPHGADNHPSTLTRLIAFLTPFLSIYGVHLPTPVDERHYDPL